MPSLVAIITLLLMSSAAYAFGSRERSAFVYTYESEAGVDRGGRLALQETELRTGAPILNSEELRLIAGLSWTKYDFLASGDEIEDLTAHSLRFPLRAILPHAEGWSWMTLVAPSIRSDFKSVTADDLGLSALAIGTYPWQPDLRLTAGAVYSQDFGRSRVFPAIGVIWTPLGAWVVDASFPRPRVTYKASEKLAISAGVEPGGDQWNVEVGGVVRDLALKEFRAGIGMEWAPVRNLIVFAQAGGVFARELEARGGGIPRDERDIEETWYARLGLVFR